MMGEIAMGPIKEKLACGGVELPSATVPQAAPTRAERSAALVEKRAAHAARMPQRPR
jgi:hypothetical protein